MPAKKKAMPRTAAKKAVVLPMKKKTPAKKATMNRRTSNRSGY